MRSKDSSNDSRKRTIAKMTLKEKILLDPLEKYVRYNKFPYKLFIHLFLILATTAQVLIVVETTMKYSRTEIRLFHRLFINKNVDFTDKDYPRSTFIFDIPTLQAKVNESRDNYYAMEFSTFDNFKLLTDSNSGDHQPIIMEVSFKESSWNSSTKYIYHIDQDDVGFFNKSVKEIKDILYNVTDIRFMMRIQSNLPNSTDTYSPCYFWNLTQIYSFEHRSDVKLDLETFQSACTSSEIYKWSMHLWIHIFVLILAFTSLFLSWKYFYDISYIYQKIKRTYKKKGTQSQVQLDKSTSSIGGHSDIYGKIESENEIYFASHRGEFENSMALDPDEVDEQEIMQGENSDNINWSQIRFTEKKQFFNNWNIISILGNTIQVSGCIIYLFNADQRLDISNVLIGFGCFIAWLNIIRYLEYSSDYFTAFSTLIGSLPRVVRHISTVLPIFLGYTFLGMSIFFESYRFSNVNLTMFTLFAIMNGDMVFDTYNDVNKLVIVIGQIYMYTYTLFFICVIQNIFISIIGDVYEEKRAEEEDKKSESGGGDTRAGSFATETESIKSGPITKGDLRRMLSKRVLSSILEERRLGPGGRAQLGIEDSPTSKDEGRKTFFVFDRKENEILAALDALQDAVDEAVVVYEDEQLVIRITERYKMILNHILDATNSQLDEVPK